MASFNENYEVKGGIDMTEGLGGFSVSSHISANPDR